MLLSVLFLTAQTSLTLFLLILCDCGLILALGVLLGTCLKPNIPEQTLDPEAHCFGLMIGECAVLESDNSRACPKTKQKTESYVALKNRSLFLEPLIVSVDAIPCLSREVEGTGVYNRVCLCCECAYLSH